MGVEIMAYGLDLRQKVINYIENGGWVTKVAQVFGIGRASIYRWLERKELAATKVKYWISIARYKRIVNRYTRKSRS